MASKGLNAWTTKLQQQNMPVLGSVITELNVVSGNEESDVNQLAEVILRDPNLTAHLLRVANSVRFNYSNTHINTVSRAIVMIGIEGVRSICLSLLLIDSLLSGKQKKRVLELIAQGFHAATQARAMIAKSTNDARRRHLSPPCCSTLVRWRFGPAKIWKRKMPI